MLALACASPAFAENYALVVSGASGGDAYAHKYDVWRASFVKTLRDKFGYPADHVVVLAERASAGVDAATRENLQRALADLRRRVRADDLLVVLLIGHGATVEDDDAKFNLVGPDLRASEWAALVKPIAGRVLFVDATSASFPFLHRLAGRGRVVLTATDSAAQQFETVFPDFFIKAFDDPAADLDKNGRISIWEAFTYASAGVRQWYEQRGQLPTERPLLDDNGDGIGREAQMPGPDGTVARALYLDAGVSPAAAGDTTQTELLKRRAELERQIEELKGRKDSMPPDEYDMDLEKLVTDLAWISAQIRSKS